MKAILRTWRRKAGFGTLLLACGFMAGRLRSCHIHDRLTFERRPGVTESMLSVDGSIIWFTDRQPGPDFLEWSTSPDITLTTFSSVPTLKAWHLVGFGAGDFQAPFLSGLVPATLRAVPYWFVVIPLTLLSGYLLVFDRVSKQPTRSQGSRTR